MENSKAPQDGKPPFSPKLTPKLSPASLTPSKRKSPEYGHLMDSRTTSLLAANRKHSRVDIIRATCDDGQKLNIWRVPFHENTNTLRQTTSIARQARLNSETFDAENRENLETNALNLESKLIKANSEKQSIISRLADLEKNFESLMSDFQDQKKTIEDLQSNDVKQQNVIAHLQSLVVNQQNEIEVQKKSIGDLQATVANQQLEIGFLQGMSPLCY